MKANEWLVPAGEARELTPDEIEAGLNADPEVTLISDYLCKALDETQALEVERRLREDEAFRAHVGPIVAAWNAWPTANDVEIVDRASNASWRRLMEQLAREEEAGDEDLDWRDAEARESDERSQRRRTRRWQLAAAIMAITTMVGAPTSVWLGYTYAKRSAAPQVHIVEAPARESQVVRVSNASWAVVSAGSRLTWRDSATTNGVRELLLDGEARFSMTKVSAGEYVVVTPSARVIVTGTEFAVDATDPTTTLVSVTEGQVVLESRGIGRSDILTLGPGERGRAIFRQPARRLE